MVSIFTLRIGRLGLLLCGLLACVLTVHAEDKECAIVLLHGKWGNPQYIAFFGRKMEPVCSFKSLEMPWAERRAYDQPYAAALADIDAQVKAFRAQGYKKVLLAGHSFGANAALAYMATIGDADAVVALAPGHSPALTYERGIGRGAVDKARELVAAGKGDERLEMEDVKQGKKRSMRMRADVLWSYFDPDGLGHMPKTAAGFKKPVPLLWVVGTADPLFALGQDFAFSKAPANAKSQYLVVNAGHLDTPDVAAAQVLAWIKNLD
ncbi:alpha/beta fold hydrolase [Rhodoferax sp.]|uniref:alpha/beta fold hydrolase n=1 Tax=Rhodoferax sp. TaxID=50421 RepID=UPI00374D365C